MHQDKVKVSVKFSPLYPASSTYDFSSQSPSISNRGHPLLPLSGNYQERRCIRTQWSDRLSGQAVGSQLLSGCVSRATERVRRWDQPTDRSCIACRETSCTSTRESVQRAGNPHRVWQVLSRLCSSHVSILNIEMWLALCGHANDCAGCFFTAVNIPIFCLPGVPSGVPHKKTAFPVAPFGCQKRRHLRVRTRGFEPPRP